MPFKSVTTVINIQNDNEPFRTNEMISYTFSWYPAAYFPKLYKYNFFLKPKNYLPLAETP